MRRRAMTVGAGLMLAASVAFAGPASASPLCLGTDDTVVLCSDPTGATYFEDCVYTGEPECERVTVPGPTLTCGGRYGAGLCPAPIIGT